MDGKEGEVGGGEEKVGAERYRLAVEVEHEAGKAGAAREPALLVIFAVVGKEGLGHDAEHPAAVDGDSAIVEAAVADDCGAEEQERLQVGAGVADGADCVERRALLRRLQVQVVDRVAGEVEFGEDDHVATLGIGGAGERDRGPRVRRGVADAGGRGGARDADHALAVEREEGMGHAGGVTRGGGVRYNL